MIRRFFVLLRAKESDSEVVSDAPDKQRCTDYDCVPALKRPQEENVSFVHH